MFFNFIKHTSKIVAIAAIFTSFASHATQFQNVDNSPASSFYGGGNGYHMVVNWGSNYASRGTKSVYLRSYGGWYNAYALFTIPSFHNYCFGAGLWTKGQTGSMDIINTKNWTYAAPIVSRNSSWSDPGEWLYANFSYGIPDQVAVRYNVIQNRAAVLDDFYLYCGVLH